MSKTQITKDRENCELIIERTIAAPVNLVWQGWTQAEHIKHWWGPKNWVTTIYEMDVRPGGVWQYSLHAEDNPEDKTWCRAVYQDVTKESRLEYTDSFTDSDGVVEPGTEMPTTVIFSPLGDETRLVIRTRFASADALDAAENAGMIEGYVETLDRFEDRITSWLLIS